MTEELDSTDRRLKVILIVEELVQLDPRGLASHADIINIMVIRHNTTKGAAKMLLNRCYHQEWLERPFRGCYRLTSKAYERLEELGVAID